MPADTDLLGSCGLLLKEEIYSSGDYSLSRVLYQGQEMIAEISSSQGIFQHRWPSVRGLVTPASARDLPGGRKLLLFQGGDGRFICEKLASTGGMSHTRALDLALKVLRIVTDLQAAGMICGYLGPEMFLLQGETLQLLAGRRGVPITPFTPPEVGGSRPSDPRSDVSALGSFLFRLIAGTDDREEQVAEWKKLPPAYQSAIQRMAAADPVNRPGSLGKAGELLESLKAPAGTQEEPPPLPHTESFLRKKEAARVSKPWFSRWYFWLPVLLLAAYLVFRYSAPPETEPVIIPDPDTLETVSPWVEDTLPEPPPPLETGLLLQDTARVWITNCSGVADRENQLRSGPFRDYSLVYTQAGTTRRTSSIITVRRSSPAGGPGYQALWDKAIEIAGEDTSFTVRPVDLTMMLGTDLRYAGVNAHFLPLPAEPPGDTLYIDVVNHGIQYALDGLGAATYAGRILDGRSCVLEGASYLIKVVDVRDADGFNREIGIPEVLEETLFLRHGNAAEAQALEQLVRQYVQALPLQGTRNMSDIPVPHLHLLIGSSADI